MTATSENLAREAAPESARFSISRRRWKTLLSELEARGGGRRESGAFLLAPLNSSRVAEVAYYDDLDATCLTGGITFSSSGFTRLWQICAEKGLTVVADIHTHPGSGVGQSRIDATNPMISTPGHVALIAPDYGRPARIDECGIYVYRGSHKWIRVPAGDHTTVVAVHGRLGREFAWTILRCLHAIVHRSAKRRD